MNIIQSMEQEILHHIVTKIEKEKAHKSWAKFYAVCDVPMDLIEHPLFKAACRSLRPTYQPPSTSCLKSRYIDELVQEDDELLKEEIDGQKIYVGADGSENNSKDSVIHIIGTGDFGSRLINQIYHKPGVKIGADQIHKDIIETRENFFDEHGIDIEYAAYVHDNENTEKATGRKFTETEGRGNFGCGPHGVNKTNHYIFLDEEFKAAQKEIDELLSKLNKGRIRSILSQNIRRSRIEKDILKNDKNGIYHRNANLLDTEVKKRLETNKKVVGFPDPGTTRQWSNMIKSFKFVSDYKAEIKMLDEQKEAEPYLHETVIDKINNQEFWD
eukprot:536860_1